MNRDKTRLVAIKKSVVTLTAIILVLASFVGSTVAYLVDASGSISSLVVLNPYVPVQFVPDSHPIGRELYAYNESLLYRAYVRVQFDVVWTNGTDTHDAVEDVHYKMNANVDNNWKKAVDGYWYCINPISTELYSAPITVESVLNPYGSAGYYLDFVVTSCTGVRADDPDIVTQVFGSGVSAVNGVTLVIIME